MKNFKHAIPTIKVTDIDTAKEFYIGRLGFHKEWEYAPGENNNPAYMAASREEIVIHLSSFDGDGVIGSVVSFAVSDVDILFEEFQNKNVAIELEPFDQSWGNREMYLNDMDGNKLRFGTW